MKKHNCPDCGPAQTLHWVEWCSSFLEWLTEPLERLTDKIFKPKITQKPTKFSSNFAEWFFKWFVLLGFGKVVTTVDSSDTGRVRVMWEAAINRGVTIKRLRVFNLPSEFFLAKYKGYSWIFTSLPRPFGVKNFGIGWMDNKGQMRDRFVKAGLPVAQGEMVSSWSKALEVFKKINSSVIVKPVYGSRSRHVTIHIQNETELLHGFRVAKQMGHFVVVEQELQGDVYRASVIAGKVAAVLRRDPPFVLGDGISTVAGLVEKANLDPKRHSEVFHQIVVDEDAKKELAYQKLSLESVPQNGVKVRLAPKVGRGNGGTNVDVTEIVHPDNLQLFTKTLEVLEDSLVGIDFIISDISKSWKEQDKCGIIECNSVPFLDLHYFPFEGRPRDAAGVLWDAVIESLK